MFKSPPLQLGSFSATPKDVQRFNLLLTGGTRRVFCASHVPLGQIKEAEEEESGDGR